MVIANKVSYNDNGFINIKATELIDWDEPNGNGCIVSDRITKEGWKVGYMYRDEPMEDWPDSGWCFLCGDEDDDYMNNSSNHHIFSINEICNYDPEIIPYLNSPVGTCYIRIEGGKFVLDDGTKSICMEEQDRVL